MSLGIVETAGEADVSRSRIYLHGPEKIGKSETASGWPKHAFLTTEARHQHLRHATLLTLNKRGQPTVKDWDDFRRIVDDLGEEKPQDVIKTVIVDVVDLLYTWCDEYMCKKENWDHKSEGGYGKGWDMIDKEFRSQIHQLLTYPYGLIFISHTKLVDIRTPDGVKSKFITTLPDRARRILLPHMGVIAYMGWDEDVWQDKEGKRHRDRVRTLFFESPDELIECGDGEGYLPRKMATSRDPQETYERIAEYYQGGR